MADEQISFKSKIKVSEEEQVSGLAQRRSVRGDSLVVRTARALSELSLSVADGDYLGAENDLLERLGISRPTLRQAAKIVESDRLITVRRGLKGGFFATRPDARDAIRAPALYLRMKGANIGQVHAVTRLISEEAAAEAARSDDPALRARLSALRAGIEGDDVADEAPGDVIQRESELAHILGEMSGNPAILLFMEIVYAFGLLSRNLKFYHREADRLANRIRQRGLCDAVLAQDPDVARLMMQRRSELIAGWIAEFNADATSAAAVADAAGGDG